MDSDFMELLQTVSHADPETVKASARAIVDAASIWQTLNGIGPLSEQDKERMIQLIESNPALTASLFGITKDPLH